MQQMILMDHMYNDMLPTNITETLKDILPLPGRSKVRGEKAVELADTTAQHLSAKSRRKLTENPLLRGLKLSLYGGLLGASAGTLAHYYSGKSYNTTLQSSIPIGAGIGALVVPLLDRISYNRKLKSIKDNALNYGISKVYETGKPVVSKATQKAYEQGTGIVFPTVKDLMS